MSKTSKPHKFIPSRLSEARPLYKYCDKCGQQRHHRLHQPLRWRMMHRNEMWRGSLS
jgi:hypothetical protein